MKSLFTDKERRDCNFLKEKGNEKKGIKFYFSLFIIKVMKYL